MEVVVRSRPCVSVRLCAAQNRWWRWICTTKILRCAPTLVFPGVSWSVCGVSDTTHEFSGLHCLEYSRIERISSFEFNEFFNPIYSEAPLDFDDEDKERTKSELSMVRDQSAGVNHQVQFIVDVESNASNTLNNGYRGYNNGEDQVLNNITSQMELNMENLYNQNIDVLNEEFGITYAPMAIKQDHVLQSKFERFSSFNDFSSYFDGQDKSLVKNYGEIPFDASILDIGSEGCTPEDYPELPKENDKREETSTLTKQNLVADSPLTNESLGVLSKKERRRQYNRESASLSREREKARVNELEATEEVFEEVKPLLLELHIADEKNIKQAGMLFREQLMDLIGKNKNAAIAFGLN